MNLPGFPSSLIDAAHAHSIGLSLKWCFSTRSIKWSGCLADSSPPPKTTYVSGVRNDIAKTQVWKQQHIVSTQFDPWSSAHRPRLDKIQAAQSLAPTVHTQAGKNVGQTTLVILEQFPKLRFEVKIVLENIFAIVHENLLATWTWKKPVKTIATEAGHKLCDDGWKEKENKMWRLQMKCWEPKI